MVKTVDLSDDVLVNLETDETYNVKIVIENEEFNEIFNSLRIEPKNKEGMMINIKQKELVEFEFNVGGRYILKNLEYKKHSNEGIFITTEKTEIEQIDNNETGESEHFATIHKSKRTVRVGTIHKYAIKKEDNQQDSKDNHSIISTVARSLRDNQEISSYAREPDKLSIYTTENIDESTYDVDGSVYSLTHQSDININYNKSEHRRIVKQLLEESIKSHLTGTDKFLVYGIDRIIEKEPFLRKDGFRAHRRYNLSVRVDSSGYAYLSIYPKTKYMSNLKLSELEVDKIFQDGSTMKLNMNYMNRSEVVPTNVCYDKSVEDVFPDLKNRTLVEYHRQSLQNNQIDKSQFKEIEESDNSPIEACMTSNGGSETKIFPQELLVVQPNTGNLKSESYEFYDKVNSYQSTTPEEYKQDCEDFISNFNVFELANTQVEFDLNFFDGNEDMKMHKIFDYDDKILRFKNGLSSKKSDIFELGVYETPDSSRICLVLPDHKDYSDFAESIKEKMSNLGFDCEFTEHTYSIKNHTDTVVSNINQACRNENFDSIVVVQPKKHNDFSKVDNNEFYNDIKKTIGNQGISSQMVSSGVAKPESSSDFKAREGALNNICVALVAKCGGIPFTVENEMPNDTDMFIGIDVAKDYSRETGTTQLSMAGAGVAVFSDGTIISTKTTRAQMGEKIESGNLKDIVRECVNSYKVEKNEKPSKISIHRDGWMNEDTSEVLEYLNRMDIEYNIIEVRKTPSERILKFRDSPRKPDQGVSLINKNADECTLITWGYPESENTNIGTPRPITVSVIDGDDNIEKIAKEVYLLSNSHYGSYRSSLRTPITTEYADRISGRATDGQTTNSDGLKDNGLSFL